MEQSCILYRSSLSYNHSWRLSPSLIPSLHPPSSTAINGADEVVPDVTDATALVLACAHGRLATVRYLLSQGADANPPLADPTQRSPLIAALQRPRVDAAVVEALLGAGADVEATLTQRYTMATTFFVLRRNDADPRVLDALLDAGAPLEGLTTKAAHMNAVWCTARTGRLDLLERVIARGGEVKGEMGAWALANAGAKAAGGARTPELMHALYLTLLNAGAGFEFRGDYDDHVCFHLPVWQEPDRATPLGEATVPFLELLAERGCVLVGLRLFRSSLLHYYAGLPAVLAWLIDHGHAPDRDAHVRLPVVWCCAKKECTRQSVETGGATTSDPCFFLFF